MDHSQHFMPTSKYLYPPNVRERATQLVFEAPRESETRNGALARIAEPTNVNKEALRNWVYKAEADNLPVEVEDMQARIRRLETEHRELRKSNGIFRSTTALFGKAEFERLQK